MASEVASGLPFGLSSASHLHQGFKGAQSRSWSHFSISLDTSSCHCCNSRPSGYVSSLSFQQRPSLLRHQSRLQWLVPRWVHLHLFFLSSPPWLRPNDSQNKAFGRPFTTGRELAFLSSGVAGPSFRHELPLEACPWPIPAQGFPVLCRAGPRRRSCLQMQLEEASNAAHIHISHGVTYVVSWNISPVCHDLFMLLPYPFSPSKMLCRMNGS